MTGSDRESPLSGRWNERLGEQFHTSHMARLREFLRDERASGKTVCPSSSDIYNALKRTPFENVKVVVLGQDPYHGLGQAHGFSFSVPDGVMVPPSLKNIFKELQSDLGITPSTSGNLIDWADQGVLLLNSVLTTTLGQAGAHRNQGWEQFTDQAIAELATHRDGLVFLLWGAYAIAKRHLVDDSRHRVLTAPHPSPLSAHRGFFGCRHFSQTNKYLLDHGKLPIDWSLNQKG